MTESYGCLCTVTGPLGNRTLKMHDRPAFDRALNRFGAGEELNLEIRTMGRKRTNAQGRFFHGPILRAFMDLGYGKQEAKDMLMLLFCPLEITLPDQTVALVPGHTSALEVQEFNALIEQCIQLAAENGLVIEDVDQWRR